MLRQNVGDRILRCGLILAMTMLVVTPPIDTFGGPSPNDPRIRPKRYNLGDEANGLMTDAIGDQGTEGACVAFAITSTMATNLVNFPPRTLNQREFDTGDFPASGVNLLDARWFYQQRGFKEEGWNIHAAAKKATEVTIPFLHGDRKYGMRIKKYVTIYPDKYYLDDGTQTTRDDRRGYEGRNLMRNLIYRRFPLVTRFDYYPDFNPTTKAGRPYPGPKAGLKRDGGHAVMMTGYSVEGNPKYWICQNSWGKQYGRDGKFLIHEGACGIDAQAIWITDWVICDMQGRPATDPAGVLQNVLIASKANTVRVFCQAGYVARFKVSYQYRDNKGETRSGNWTSKNLSAGRRDKKQLPPGAFNVKVTGYALIGGEKAISTMNVDFRKEYKVYGTIFGKRMTAQ